MKISYSEFFCLLYLLFFCFIPFFYQFSLILCCLFSYFLRWSLIFSLHHWLWKEICCIFCQEYAVCLAWRAGEFFHPASILQYNRLKLEWALLPEYHQFLPELKTWFKMTLPWGWLKVQWIYRGIPQMQNRTTYSSKSEILWLKNWLMHVFDSV